MTRRRVLTLPLALIGLLLMAAPAGAQARIYWSVDQEVWSMNPDGSGKTNLFPAGLVPPAPYDTVDSIAGPGAGSYPIDPSVVGSPSARWWLAVVSGPDSPYTALFAFAQDGQGTAVWRPLTNIPREPAPGVVINVSNAFPVLPTGPGDGFASFQVLEVVSDGVTSQSTYKLVRFADPFTRPAGSVTLDQLETLVAGGPSDAPGAHTWSPDGRTLAYIGRQHYPDGSNLGALRLLDTVTGADSFLLDSRTSGIQPNRPRWSPDGGEIAFDSNNYSNAGTGTYAVKVFSGAVRAVATAGSTANFFSQPVWSPDGSLMAGVQYYSGSNSKLRNRSAIARFPSSGVTKKNGVVLLTPTSDPYRYQSILNWR